MKNKGKDIREIIKMSEGYSCADMNAFIKEAAMLPVRELTMEQLQALKD